VLHHQLELGVAGGLESKPIEQLGEAVHAGAGASACSSSSP
jgi:hypothetical protein